MHPLDRAEDDGDASPIDPDHRGRYYVDPTCRAEETDQTKLPGAVYGDVVTARYKLPDGVTCDHCIVQMVYYTGNSCKHPGYDDFNPPSWPSECAPTKADWVQTSLGMCGMDGRYPEEFWNCADISSQKGKKKGIPCPTPSPVTEGETPSPVTEGETPSPVTEGETPSPVTEGETPSPVTEGETPSPVTEGETPSPVTTMEPPAPTPTTPTPTPTCDDPADAYDQCGGGDSYDGPNCCVEDFECVELADCYSEVR
ncbi:unnamed protein product, partial [Hapterophycus canaliculatus]